MGLVLFLVRLRRRHATVQNAAWLDAALHPAALLYSIAAIVSRAIRARA